MRRWHLRRRPAELQLVLAEALGDPGFRIAYPGPDGFVDGDGGSVSVPSADADRSVTYVEQDGIADAGHGSGLRGLVDRIEALDGTLRITSPPGGGTVVAAETPRRA